LAYNFPNAIPRAFQTVLSTVLVKVFKVAEKGVIKEISSVVKECIQSNISTVFSDSHTSV
jgi:hypothetical protein